jgi:predicted acyl esterase
VEARNDVLVYTTPSCSSGTEISGPISVSLYVSSSAKDTDFTFRVDDVYPDGRAFNLIENISACATAMGTTNARYGWNPGPSTK